MIEIKEPKYAIEDVVVYAMGGALGKVIDISYSFKYKSFKYLISFSYAEQFWCCSEELNK